MFENKYNKEFERGEILQEAIDSLNYPFYVIDIETYEIIVANKKMKLDLESGEKYKCHKVTHRNESPCSSKEDPCPISEIKKTGSAFMVEHTHFDENGEARRVEVHAYPIFDESGKIVQMIEYSIDVTEKKKMEEEIKMHTQELKRMNDLMMGRELKMIEMKKEIERLKSEK